MRSSRVLIAAVGLMLMSQVSASAESKWSFKNLLPGVDKTEKPTLPRPEGRTSFGKPKSGNAFTAPFKRMGDDTKRLLGKTKALVPSWASPKPKRNAKESPNVVTSSFRKVNSELKVAHRKMMAPWKNLGKSPEPKKPRDVGEFLSQPRPK